MVAASNHRRAAQDGYSIDRDARGDRLIAGPRTSRPTFLVPSPDMSMVRRLASKGARSRKGEVESLPIPQ